MTHEPALPPLPDPIRQVVYNESKGYAFSAYTADQMRAYARAALDTGRPQYDWSLLEATQESLREHMAEIQRLRAALAQPATIAEWWAAKQAASEELSSVSPKAQTEFMQALHGGQGTLDAWLECNNEADVRAHVLALVQQPASSGEPATVSDLLRRSRNLLSHPPLWWQENEASRERLIGQLDAALHDTAQPAPARVPLTDEQIDRITTEQWGAGLGAPYAAYRAYARAIEAAHGITQAKEAP